MTVFVFLTNCSVSGTGRTRQIILCHWRTVRHPLSRQRPQRAPGIINKRRYADYCENNVAISLSRQVIRLLNACISSRDTLSKRRSVKVEVLGTSSIILGSCCWRRWIFIGIMRPRSASRRTKLVSQCGFLLNHHKLACIPQRFESLRFPSFDRNKVNAQAACRFTDRQSIVCVILLAF